MFLQWRYRLTLVMLGVFMTCSVHATQFNVLVFTKTAGWHHSSVHEGITAMRTLAALHNFRFEWHEDANHFNDKKLSEFDAVVFLQTTGDVLNEAQQQAFQRFIRSGKGYVGVHSAADTEHDWQWYRQLVGHSFYIHPPVQTARLQNLVPTFPGMESFTQDFIWTDEYYEYSEAHIEGLNYLLSIDESTYDVSADWGEKQAKGMGNFHPLAWYHNYDGGRAFYTGLGHMGSTYSDQRFLNHLYGGIYWSATGKGILAD